MAKKKVEDETLQIPDNNEVRAQIPATEDEVVNTPSEEEKQEFDGDISLDVVRKKRFRIDGDNNRILELNTSDMTVINRLERLYPELQALSQSAAVKQLDKSLDLKTVSTALEEVDKQMRAYIDEIFDAPVSKVCAPFGSMFDPFNGEFRFEHIIDIIGNLYTDNINAETKKISARMKKHTDKYTKVK